MRPRATGHRSTRSVHRRTQRPPRRGWPEWGVDPICTVLGEYGWQIATSTYYAARVRPPSARTVSDELLLPKVVALHKKNRSVYGVHKMWKAARRDGWDIGRDRMGRLMKIAGLTGVLRRKSPRTTISDDTAARFPDRVQRRWDTGKPDAVWVADFTYVHTLQGFCYTAFCVDAASRRILGWTVAPSKSARLVTSVVEQALGVRRRDVAEWTADGLIHHSDAGSQSPTTDLLNQAGFRTFPLDQRGYAPGARPTGRAAYRMSELVGDVAVLIERVGTPVTLVGHDWGAAVAWNVATRHPALVRHLVAATVPHPAAFFLAMTRSRQLVLSWYIGFFQLPALPELASTRFGWMARWLGRGLMPPPARAAWRHDFLAAGCLAGALAWYRALPLLEPRQVRVKVTVPTTFLWSDRDFALSRKGAELTTRYVAAPYRYVELAGHSHWLIDEAPDTFAECVIQGPPKQY